MELPENGEPVVDYVVWTPEGEILLDDASLGRPLLLAPGRSHPTLTLGHYFCGLAGFARTHAPFLLGNASTPCRPDVVKRISIRSEKHGAYYHIARIDLTAAQGKHVTLAAVTPSSFRGEKGLNREYELLCDLNHRFETPFLPRTLLKGEVRFAGETFPIMLLEWLDGFHEWHLMAETGSDDRSVRAELWDTHRGYRILSPVECGEIYCCVSGILTCFYDRGTHRRIRSWSHAAGDFVIRSDGTCVQAKLTTVREYECLDGLPEDRTVRSITALLYYFLELCLKMRLDKRNGTDEVLWAGEWCMDPILQGFFGALQWKEGVMEQHAAPLEEILSLFQSFSKNELHTVMESVLDSESVLDPEERQTVNLRLPAHVRELRTHLQRFQL